MGLKLKPVYMHPVFIFQFLMIFYLCIPFVGDQASAGCNTMLTTIMVTVPSPFSLPKKRSFSSQCSFKLSCNDKESNEDSCSNFSRRLALFQLGTGNFSQKRKRCQKFGHFHFVFVLSMMTIQPHNFVRCSLFFYYFIFGL